METNNNEQKLVSWDKLTIQQQNEIAEEVKAVLDTASDAFKYNSMIIGMSFAAMDVDGAVHEAAKTGNLPLMNSTAIYVRNHHKLFQNILRGNMAVHEDFSDRLEAVFTKHGVDVKEAGELYAALRGAGERIYAKALGISDEECVRHIKAEKAMNDLWEALFGKND